MTFASGTSKQAVVAYLRGEQAETAPGAPPPQTLAERIAWKAPYPLLRHHFGRPTVDETVAGVVEIARAECLDVLSLGTDQNAQEHFFRPDRDGPEGPRRRRRARPHRGRPGRDLRPLAAGQLSA